MCVLSLWQLNGFMRQLLVLRLRLFMWLLIVECVVMSSMGVVLFDVCRLCRIVKLFMLGRFVLSMMRLKCLMCSSLFVVVLLVLRLMVWLSWVRWLWIVVLILVLFFMMRICMVLFVGRGVRGFFEVGMLVFFQIWLIICVELEVGCKDGINIRNI